MTNQIINRINGQLTISNNLIISKETKKERIANHFGLDNLTIKDMRNGWVHYNMKDVIIASKSFAFTFLYENENLECISFVLDYSIDDAWDNWNEEKELKKLAKYSSWLIGQVGMQSDFTWGTIKALYDPKGASSNILLRYI